MSKIRHFARASQRFEPGMASDFIQSFNSIRRDDKVVLFVRVSGPSQDPIRQLEALRLALRERGASVVEECVFRCSGYDKPSDETPSWATCTWEEALLTAAEVARKNQAKLIATETDRLIRSRLISINKSSWNARATKTEFEELAFLTNGIQLVSLADPDESPAEVKKMASEQGQIARGSNHGGRPPKLRAKPRGSYMPRPTDSEWSELEAHLKKGRSVRKIAWLFDRKPSTVQGWINQLNERNQALCTNCEVARIKCVDSIEKQSAKRKQKHSRSSHENR